MDIFKNLQLKHKFWLLNIVSLTCLLVLSIFAIYEGYSNSLSGVTIEDIFTVEFISYAIKNGYKYAIIVGILITIVMTSSQALISFVLKNIENLNHAMHEVKDNGDLSIRVKVVSEDEIGDMSLTFNKMQESLHNLSSELFLISQPFDSRYFHRFNSI